MQKGRKGKRRKDTDLRLRVIYTGITLSPFPEGANILQYGILTFYGRNGYGFSQYPGAH